jgi:hypothetical protein
VAEQVLTPMWIVPLSSPTPLLLALHQLQKPMIVIALRAKPDLNLAFTIKQALPGCRNILLTELARNKTLPLLVATVTCHSVRALSFACSHLQFPLAFYELTKRIDYFFFW